MNKLKKVHQKILVNILFIFNIIILFFIFLSIVIGLAANKCDLFDNESVSEESARKFAEEIGAIFKLTSACNATGIEELFISVGSKYLDPNYKDDGSKKVKENYLVMDQTINPPLDDNKQEKNKEPKNTDDEDNPQKNRGPSIRLNPEKLKQKKNKKKCC